MRWIPRCLAVWLVASSGCGQRPPGSDDPASSSAAASVGVQPHPSDAKVDSADRATVSAANLGLRLELVDGVGASVPTAIRLTLRNSSSGSYEFEEPSPVCPESAGDDRPYVALVLTDDDGNESEWTPVLTELFAINLPERTTRTLAPGASWSAEYSLDRLYFWGPCGPAMPISELLAPEAPHLSVRAVVGRRGGEAVRSDPVDLPTVRVNWLFARSTPTGLERARSEGFGESTEEARRAEIERFEREERRRRAAAFRALRTLLVDVGEEPLHDGRRVTEWLEVYCDREDRALEGDPTAARERADAANAMVALGGAAAPFLMAILDLESEVAGSAVDLLRKMYEAGKVPDSSLIEILEGESSRSRERILEVLDASLHDRGNRGALVEPSPELVGAIARLLREPTMFFERYRVAMCFARPGLVSAVPILTELLRDEDPTVRISAAEALAAIGPKARASIPELRSLREDSPDARTRRVARRTLRALGEEVAEHADVYERAEAHFFARIAERPIDVRKESELDDLTSDAAGVFFLVDRSGSSTEGFRLAQRYIAGRLARLRAGTRVRRRLRGQWSALLPERGPSGKSRSAASSRRDRVRLEHGSGRRKLSREGHREGLRIGRGRR